MEAPGLDFGGSGLDFPRFWTSKTMPEGLPGWRTLCHQLVLHHWAVRGRKVAEILPSHGTSASNACASVSWRRWARCSRSGVAGGVPPLGAFNPPATEGVPTACWTNSSNWLLRITAGPSRHSFAQFGLKCSFPYPFLSPAAWGPPEPSSKKSLSVSCWLILVDFLPFRIALEK